MTITLKNRLGESIDGNELLECFDCILICRQVWDYDCSDIDATVSTKESTLRLSASP